MGTFQAPGRREPAPRGRPRHSARQHVKAHNTVAGNIAAVRVRVIKYIHHSVVRAFASTSSLFKRNLCIYGIQEMFLKSHKEKVEKNQRSMFKERKSRE